jgi:hypothetical protein
MRNAEPQFARQVCSNSDFLNSTFECETGVVEEDGGVTKAFDY